MSKEKDLLLKMRAEHKINEAEYKTLSAVIDPKRSKLGRAFNLLINPFQKIAGYKALVLGVALILVMSGLEVYARLYSVGTLGIMNASIVKNNADTLNYGLLLYQNGVAWLTLSVLYILAALACRQKRLRFIDFFGTVALARYPVILLCLVIMVLRLFNSSFMDIDLSKGLDLHPSLFNSIGGGLIFACFAWEIATYFFALKESSGLHGKKLWLSFIAACLIGEMIAGPLTMMFLK